jgi:hypothetical protein
MDGASLVGTTKHSDGSRCQDKMHRPYQAPTTQHVFKNEGWFLWQGNQKHTSFDLMVIHKDLTEHITVEYCVWCAQDFLGGSGKSV